MYNGLVSYITYQGDLGGFQLDPRVLLIEYEGLQLRGSSTPRHTTQEQQLSRLPDFRNLLYWSPTLKTQANGKATCSFYTSDQEGTYMMVVQGMSKAGLVGSGVMTFEVKRPL